MTDIEIARQAKLDSIDDIAQRAGIHPEALIRQGSHMAKIDVSKLPGKQPGKLVLVTAINPTPAGEGKTTTSVGLADGLALIGKRVMLALREPSLGPVFGVKGGAAGGGYSQVLPMEEINLHFTGDLHAITSANNLLAALIDNHIQQGNELELDPRRIVWRRCLDMNDRQLRSLIDGLGGNKNGVPREDGFDITAASEIMAVLCLSDGIADLKQNIGRITVGYNTRGQLVTAGDLGAQGAMSALLKQALLPNLVQTLAHTPALVHGGPFANIAHGCNSIIATRTALGLADYTITEAGFGADLGAEKFLDIKCRKAGIAPDAVVIVASVRALKFHGGVAKDGLQGEDVAAVKRGMPNLIKHIQNMTTVYHLPVVVAINRFASDSDAEMQAIKDACQEIGVSAIVADVWGKGGQGARELAAAVAALCEQSSQMTLAYEDGDSYQSKIEQVATKVYGAGSVTLSAQAHAELGAIEAAGYARLPICIAKTQYSLSDDPGKKGRPEGFELTIRSARLSAGAGFVVVFAGDIIAMPGLPKDPAANHIDIDAEGNISGLF